MARTKDELLDEAIKTAEKLLAVVNEQQQQIQLYKDLIEIHKARYNNLESSYDLLEKLWQTPPNIF